MTQITTLTDAELTEMVCDHCAKTIDGAVICEQCQMDFNRFYQKQAAEIERLSEIHSECDEILTHVTSWGGGWRDDYQETFTKLAERDAEIERLRAALGKIASSDGAYLACSDLPHCSGGSGTGHALDCAAGIAQRALSREVKQ